jgi:hypothetical protein
MGYRLMRAELSPPLSNLSPDREALAGWLTTRACSPVVVFNLAIELYSRVQTKCRGRPGMYRNLPWHKEVLPTPSGRIGVVFPLPLSYRYADVRLD